LPRQRQSSRSARWSTWRQSANRGGAPRMAASAWRSEEADSSRPLHRAASKARGYEGDVGPEASRLPRRGAGQAQQEGSEEQLAALDVRRHLPQINDTSLGSLGKLGSLGPRKASEGARKSEASESDATLGLCRGYSLGYAWTTPPPTPPRATTAAISLPVLEGTRSQSRRSLRQCLPPLTLSYQVMTN